MSWGATKGQWYTLNGVSFNFFVRGKNGVKRFPKSIYVEKIDFCPKINKFVRHRTKDENLICPKTPFSLYLYILETIQFLFVHLFFVPNLSGRPFYALHIQPGCVFLLICAFFFFSFSIRTQSPHTHENHTRARK